MIIKYKDIEINFIGYYETLKYIKDNYPLYLKQFFNILIENNEFKEWFYERYNELNDFRKHPNTCIICKSKCKNKFCKNCFNSFAYNEYIKKLKLERYGNENYNNRNKMKATKLERYGNENYTNIEKQKQTIASKSDEEKLKIKEKLSLSQKSKSKEQKDKIQKKKENTKLERYGSKTYNNSSKTKQTKLEKYGSENYNNIKKQKLTVASKSQEELQATKEKRIQTNLEKYSSEYVFQLKDIKDKIKQTKLDSYGSKTYNNSTKIKKTKLEKYGDENYNNCEKANQTNLIKYGFKRPAQSTEIKSKIRNTSLEKYGVSCHTQQHIQNLNQLNEEYIRDNFINDKWFLIDEFVQYFGFKSLTTGYNYKNLFNILEPKKTLLVKEPLFLDTLEEILKVKIQRQFKIKNYKVDGFISFEDSKYLVTQGIIEKPKSIAIEFLGDYWHGFKNNDELSYFGISFSDLYKLTFKRFDDILLQKEVDEIWYLWENQFSDFINIRDLNIIHRYNI